MKQILLCSIVLFLISCQKANTIEGLWEVEVVTVGEETMTPQAKWTRFNKDHSQESGNGWYKHSVGTWNLDTETQQLKIINTNSYKDPADPFVVKLEKDKMTWTRTEEGMLVEVQLKRIESLPQTPEDQLMGVWDLEKVSVDGIDSTKVYDPNQNWYMFISWDKRFRIRNTPKGLISGVYQVHSHKPQLNLFIYGDSIKYQSWNFEIKPKRLTLRNTQEGVEIIKEYKRIDYFLD